MAEKGIMQQTTHNLTIQLQLHHSYSGAPSYWPPVQRGAAQNVVHDVKDVQSAKIVCFFAHLDVMDHTVHGRCRVGGQCDGAPLL